MKEENKIFQTVKSPTFVVLVVFLLLITSLIGVAVYVLGGPQKPKSASTSSSNAVQTDGDKQIVNIEAKGGFSPNKVNLSANKPTVLRVTTENTIDCSNTLIIPALKKQINLQTTGTAEVEIPAQSSGSKITATCSMGMYNLELNFM